MTHTPRVFSGVQPTGSLTLGNYLGAIKRFVELQDTGMETIYCMVDMHAITDTLVHHDMRDATRELAAAFMACGLDPAKSILFNQSQVSAHAELGWLFSCVVRLGLVESDDPVQGQGWQEPGKCLGRVVYVSRADGG